MMGGQGQAGFNAEAYLAANPGLREALAAARVDPYTHWITHGQKEGRPGAFGPVAPAAPAAPAGPPPPPAWAPSKDASGKRDWGSFRQAAQGVTQGINNMPFMLDPQKLSGASPQQSRGMMYPGLAAIMSQQASQGPQQSGNPLLQQSGNPLLQQPGITPEQQSVHDNWFMQQAAGPLNGG